MLSFGVKLRESVFVDPEPPFFCSGDGMKDSVDSTLVAMG